MPLIGNALPSLGDDLGDIIADVWDYGFNVGLRQPYNDAAQPVSARLSRAGNIGNEGGVGTQCFWRLQTSDLNTKYPAASQYLGTDRTQSRSSTNLELKCNYFPWMAGLDPVAAGLGVLNIPFWYHIRVEYTIAKADAAFFDFCGWANGGGSLGDWVHPNSIGGLGFAVMSDVGETTWTRILRRGDPSFGAPVLQTPLLVTGIDAMTPQRMQFDLYTGPALLMEFRIAGQLVYQLDVSEFSNLSGVGIDEMSMRHEIRGNGPMNGPYCSRATLRKSAA